MLIGFRVFNWRSIRNEVSFSMLASQERQHGERLKWLGKYRCRLLPTALMFGGNASGKSNFVRALDFMKNFILKPPQPHQGIPGYNPYVFDKASKSGASEFEIEMLIDEHIYRYSFTINAKSVLREELVKILTTREQSLFAREGNVCIQFDDDYPGDELQRLEIIFQGTQDNELFLSNSVDQNVELFKPIYDWFDHHLHIVDPSARFLALEPVALELCNQYFPLLDTSVKRLGFNEVSRSYIPKEDFERFIAELPLGGSVLGVNPISGERYLLHKNDDNTIDTQLLFSYHETLDGEEHGIKFVEESDGTKRLLDLLPAFVGDNDCTIVIDEIDRSLHSIVTKQLFTFFLAKSEQCFNKQIIATTHDLQLMTQDLFRRDEMWIFERRENGTDLIPLSDFKDIRFDSDIRKSYLEGRMGGIPQMMLPLPDFEECE